MRLPVTRNVHLLAVQRAGIPTQLCSMLCTGQRFWDRRLLHTGRLSHVSAPGARRVPPRAEQASMHRASRCPGNKASIVEQLLQACRDSHRCSAGLRAQAEALRGDLSVVQTLVEAAPDAATNDVKALLGRMMFSGLAMDKKVRPGPPCWAFPGTWGPCLLRLVDSWNSSLQFQR